MEEEEVECIPNKVLKVILNILIKFLKIARRAVRHESNCIISRFFLLSIICLFDTAKKQKVNKKNFPLSTSIVFPFQVSFPTLGLWNM